MDFADDAVQIFPEHCKNIHRINCPRIEPADLHDEDVLGGTVLRQISIDDFEFIPGGTSASSSIFGY